MSMFKLVSMCLVFGIAACPSFATTVPAGWTPSSVNCEYFATGGNPGGFAQITGFESQCFTWTSDLFSVTANTLYNVALDYKTGAQGTFAQFEYYNANGGWLGKYEFYDFIAGGWLPSFNNSSTWTAKTGSFTTGADVAQIRVILYNWCGWGNVSSFDNVSLKTATGPNLVYNGGFAVPEPMTMAVLGLGSLWLVRKK